MNILFGVAGSVAAHRGLELARALMKTGHNIRVILSESGARFVQPIAFKALVGPTYTDKDFFNSALHIELAQWADLSVIAPVSANTLAKLAHGRADNLLSASFLAKGPPGILVPAMHESMWLSDITQANVKTLREAGYTVLQPVSGDLSVGAGLGRMPELDQIFSFLQHWQAVLSKLKGVKVVLAYGPTAEPIDPVRVITNKSSGKMGVALGRALSGAGALVSAISGPGVPPVPGDNRVQVQTGEEMRQAIEQALDHARVLIMAAAVADFKPRKTFNHKLKRAQSLSLELEPTQDILASLARNKREDQLFVGFCLAQKNELLSVAREKMKAKSVDIMVANGLEALGSDAGEFYILTPQRTMELGRVSKDQLAARLIQVIAESLP